MAALPLSVVDPVANAIFANYKAKFGDEPQRPYLGASAIGKPCLRQHWYSFRWSKPSEFPGRIHRVFQSGHLQEPRVYADLKAIGCVVYDIDPSTGKQWNWNEPHTNGHFRGNADGIITNLPQSPKTPHILEIKTSSDKMFKIMQKDGVKKAKPEHYAQMMIYMHWSIAQFGENGCTRAFYIVVNKNDDDIYTERLEYNKDEATALVEKAIAIIDSAEPPVGISKDPSWYECKFCEYHSICHGTDVPAPTCRSCAHATPEMEGAMARWSCSSHQKDISIDTQRVGCEGHRYIPVLLEKFAQPIDMIDTAVMYQMGDKQFVNGDPGANSTYLSSSEIHACKDKTALTDITATSLRLQHGGKFV